MKWANSVECKSCVSELKTKAKQIQQIVTERNKCRKCKGCSRLTQIRDVANKCSGKIDDKI